VRPLKAWHFLECVDMDMLCGGEGGQTRNATCCHSAPRSLWRQPRQPAISFYSLWLRLGASCCRRQRCGAVITHSRAGVPTHRRHFSNLYSNLPIHLVLVSSYICWRVCHVTKEPCGGGFSTAVPASRKRRQKGNPVPGGITGPPCSWGI
jgi:hypothetical protein